MIISYNTAYSNFSLNNGFGRAGFNIVNSLKQLGHKVYFQTPIAPIEFTFAQPDYFTYSPDQYQIIMTPWESTELHPNWIEKFSQADEVWATSDWVADVYKKAGVKNVMRVFPHGIEKNYKPKLKKRKGPLRYVHIGGPANRKGAQEAFDSFRSVFKDDKTKATLTIKSFKRNLVRWYDQDGCVRNPADLPNVEVITQEFEPDELLKFQSEFDVAIYPTAGEGFGFIPLEFLAQGTPTISTYDWSHYAEYFGDLAVESSQVKSSWPHEHPGLVYKPDMSDLENKIRLSYEDFENQSKEFFKRSFDIHEKFDWLTLTEQAFESIEERFG